LAQAIELRQAQSPLGVALEELTKQFAEANIYLQQEL